MLTCLQFTYFLRTEKVEIAGLKILMKLTTGYGSSNGLNFIVNSFEPYSLQRSSKNSVISITNENNAFDIFQQKFIISPGYSYTFKVVATQTVTTERFNSMDVADRGCLLPGDNSYSSV